MKSLTLADRKRQLITSVKSLKNLCVICIDQETNELFRSNRKFCAGGMRTPDDKKLFLETITVMVGYCDADPAEGLVQPIWVSNAIDRPGGSP